MLFAQVVARVVSLCFSDFLQALVGPSKKEVSFEVLTHTEIPRNQCLWNGAKFKMKREMYSVRSSLDD